MATKELSGQVLGCSPSLYGKTLFYLAFQEETHAVPVLLFLSKTAQSRGVLGGLGQIGVSVGVGVGVGIVGVVALSSTCFDQSDAAGGQKHKSFVLQVLAGKIG
jgi:hypothetical protein